MLCPELGFCRLRELEEVAAGAAAANSSSSSFDSRSAGVLADGLEHPVALVGEAQEALLDERLQGVEVGFGHLLGGLERAAAGEDGEAGEEPLLLGGEQVVAPLDGGAERLLAGVGVAAALQEVEALGEALEDLGGRERLRARGGELDRERERVEAHAELGDLLAGLELRRARRRGRRPRARRAEAPRTRPRRRCAGARAA